MKKTLLDLQDKLNIFTAGNNWTSGISSNGKEIDWWRCIYMEAAEAIDSLPWKHWKHKDEDIENLKVEVTDILHFIASLAIMHNCEIKLSDNEPCGDLTVIEVLELIINRTSRNKRFYNKSEFIEDTYQVIGDFNVLLSVLKKEYNIGVKEIKEIYIGKNCLNIFRQSHGYKDGSYKKIWNGKEDNVYMLEIIKETNNPRIIFEKLEKIYSSVKD